MIRKQYNAVRNSVGLFDLNDQAKIFVKGEDGEKLLDTVITGNAYALAEGDAMYTAICHENGGVSALMWLLRDEEFFYILSDTQKRDTILECLKSADQGNGVELEDVSENMGCLSIIGPDSFDVAQEFVGDDIYGLPYLGCEHHCVDNLEFLTSRIGITGEYEYRFMLPKDSIHVLRQRLMEAASVCGIEILPCDPAVLDTCLLEMKSINQNKDFDHTITLLEAGLHWMVDFRKERFIGHDSIFQAKKGDLKQKLLLLTVENAQALAKKQKVFLNGKGTVGYITHWEYSPTLDKGIALACIDGRYAWVGLEFEIAMNGGEIVKAQSESPPLFETKTTIKVRS